MIPIFDCLTHPSLDSSWVNPKWNNRNSFLYVTESLQKANVKWALAVSMGNIGAYDVHQYVKVCKEFSDVKFFPVAFMNLSEFTDVNEIERWLIDIQKKGFNGIKLHPRLSRFGLTHPHLPQTIIMANKLGLFPLLCTYFYSRDESCCDLTVEALRELLYKIPDEKLILLHSGTMRLLEISEMTRPFKKILLDLSFTMCEFSGSSIDLDLRYVMERCRGRVCIGSDSPEISPLTMRSRFEQLTIGFSKNHCEEIAFRNLFTFTGLSYE